MKTTPVLRWTAALSLCGILFGCIPSLHPLYTKETAVFDEKLVGTWSDKNSTWTFTKSADKAYELVFTDENGRKGRFTANLVKLDDRLYLDLLPRDLKSEDAAFWKFHFLKAHSFLLVDELGDTLTMRMMDPSWLQKHLENNPDAIAITKVQDRPVLTAPTEELQKFLAKLAKMPAPEDDSKGPFTKPLVLKKK